MGVGRHLLSGHPISHIIVVALDPEKLFLWVEAGYTALTPYMAEVG